jgi:hypothetical protein
MEVCRGRPRGMERAKRDAEETNIWSDTPEVFARKLKSNATLGGVTLPK